MRLSAFLASLTLVAVVLGGCSGDGGGDGTSTSTSSSASETGSVTGSSTSRSATGTTTSASTTSNGSAQNSAPTGSVSASIKGTNVTFSLTGADPDGDPLTWDLDFGDGSEKATGTELPAEQAHVYAAGNYTANLTVSDGKESVSYQAPIAATAAAGATGQSFSGSWDVGAIGCVAPQQPYLEPADGIDAAVFDVDRATIGRPFLATFTGSALFNGLSFYDGATPAGHVEDFDDIAAPGAIEGVVPAGAVRAMAYSCLGAAGITYATS